MKAHSTSNWINTSSTWGFALSLVGLAALYVAQPLADPDFWWHLKTGELLVESRGLLPADPFSFSGDVGSVSPRERTILDGYWLWQIIAYACYQIGGFPGIRLLGLLTLAGIYWAVGTSLVRSNVRLAIGLPLCAVSLILFQRFMFLERPQICSFLFAALLVGFFVSIRQGARPSWWLYPVMALWGNLHGGVVVGAALLVLFALGSCWDFRADRQRLRRVLLWCAGGGALSFVNPNGSGFYTTLFATLDQGMAARVTEYRSTFMAFANEKAVVLLWLLIVVHFWALWKASRHPPLADLLVSGILAGLAVFYVRNMPFAAVALLPLTGYSLEKAAGSFSPGVHKALRSGYMIMAGIFFVYVLLTAKSAYAARSAGQRGDISQVFPRQLTEFLIDAPISGNIFNSYNWGGYFLWTLYPQYKLFIDGRGIDEQALSDYYKIADVSTAKINGRYEYEVLLDQYGIDVVVMNMVTDYGGVNTLLKYLLTKPEWYPAYQDDLAYVMVKAGGNSDSAMKSRRIDKQVFLARMLEFYDKAIRSQPLEPRYYLGRGELLGFIGRYDDAERDFATVGKFDPGNPHLPIKMRQVEKLRELAREKG